MHLRSDPILSGDDRAQGVRLLCLGRRILGLSNRGELCYHQPHDLLSALRNIHKEIDPKMIQITEIAKKRITVLKQDQETNHGKKIEGLRLMVKSMSPSPEYALAFVEQGKNDPNDIMVEVDGIPLFMESRHANFLEDVKIDFITGLQQTGFKVENPKVIEPKPATPSTPPNLESPQAKAVQKVLDTEINPAVAAHGGYVSLVDVKEDIAYIRLGGGCQGCGMANVTMKQGVVVAIKKAIPEIKDVLDITDHAGGSNPYYSPGK
jgi:Fe/S biogenesis protein NfuA